MDFYKIFLEIMDERKMTIPDIARACGLSDSTVRSIVDRKQKKIALEIAFKLSKGLNVSLERLNGMPEKVKDKNAYQLSASISTLINKYNSLDKYGKKAVEGILEIELQRVNAVESYNEDDDEDTITLSLSELKASAGTGFYLGDEYMVDTKVVLNDLTRRADFAVPVDGHSMEPKYSDGDIILVRQQPDIDVGEIGLYIVDGNGFVKRKGRDSLISLNKDYADIPLSEFNEIKCCGKVVGKLEKNWIKE